jgi:alkanesulfonate monooxygenase SsuD/methylene tetrahydromethanopterin reductase-like flavin-dependent oxidoreductase (luciferase family)
MALAQVSIGVAGSLGPQAIARIAQAVEDTGFHGLWVNDTPQGDSIGALGAAAEVTERLVLATGVVPVDRRPASEIAAAVRDARIPESRLVLGIGSGQTRVGALRMVRDAAAELRDALDARVVVGALGPRMRELAERDADGPLLSWLTPEIASAQAEEARTRNPAAHVALYVRAAVEEAAEERLAEEAARYGSYPAYAANFARHGIAPIDTVLGPADIAARITGYRDAVDEVVLRAITPADDVEAYERFVVRAGELLGVG